MINVVYLVSLIYFLVVIIGIFDSKKSVYDVNVNVNDSVNVNDGVD